jgi:hypothetical protein
LAAEVTKLTTDDREAPRLASLEAEEVEVPVLISVFVVVPVLVFVVGSEAELAEVVVTVPVVGDDCPLDVGVVGLSVPSVAPTETVTWITTELATDTAPPTITVSEPGSLEERLLAVEAGAVVLRNGPTCLLISLGK